MRVLVLVRATSFSEAGHVGSPAMFEAMGRFNRELAEAGVLVMAEGLTPSAQGVRVGFDGDRRVVQAGPFGEPASLVAGFWLWEVRDMAEAVEWVKRCPAPMPEPSEIEIRPLWELG